MDGVNLCPGVVNVFSEVAHMAAGDGEVRCADDTGPTVIPSLLLLDQLFHLSSDELAVLLRVVTEALVTSGKRFRIGFHLNLNMNNFQVDYDGNDRISLRISRLATEIAIAVIF